MEPDITPLVDAAALQDHVAGLADQIDRAFADTSDLVLVGVLRGAVYFLADLSRSLRTPHRIDFVEYQSYRGTDKGDGRLVKDCSGSVEGADVVIVDEVCDTGDTLARLREVLASKRPRSLATCALFVKGQHAKDDLPEFQGVAVGEEFLVGYGMDLDQRLRHLPFVGTIREERGS
jgi:hypoxanthine phosphoribosyltransferase